MTQQKTQSDKFKDLAHEVEADEDERKLYESLKKMRDKGSADKKDDKDG